MAKKSKPSKSPSARQRDYKAEYARRIARAEAKGKTRQQARGHKVREHVIRREREIAKRGLTNDQERIIRVWSKKHKNHERPIRELLAWTKENGYDAFKTYRSTWEANRRRYVKNLRKSKYQPQAGMLDYLAEELDIPEISWLYYH